MSQHKPEKQTNLQAVEKRLLFFLFGHSAVQKNK